MYLEKDSFGHYILQSLTIEELNVLRSALSASLSISNCDIAFRILATIDLQMLRIESKKEEKI